MAAAGAAPMQVDTLVELASLGIPATSMAFTHVTMQSEKFICVRETGAANNVVIVETANPSNPMRRPITADSAILAHTSKVIALKAYQADVGDSLQVFNLETKSKLKTHTMPNEKVVFWTWLSDSTVGIITDTAAYHWDMTDADPPKKKFDRTANLNGAQIISYKVSSDGKWCTLVGIAPGAPERPQLVKGYMQLYSVEQNRSQALEAHTAAFSTLQLNGVPTPVIAFTTKNVKDGVLNSKVHVIALGGAHKKQAELFFPEGFADDFPVSLQMSEKFGLVYVVTKMGLLFVYDLENLTAIYRSRISADPIFLAQAAPTAGGIYVVNRRGTVMNVNVNPATMVPFIANSLKSVDLAIKVAGRGNLPGAESLFVQQFEQQYNAGQHKEAAETAARAPGGVLRTQATITKLQKAPTQPGQKSPLLVYFGLLLQSGALNAIESVEMARLVISQNRKEMLTNWMRDNKLTPSEQLGDLIKDGAGDSQMALQVYKACGASKKEVLCHAEAGDIGALIAAAGAVPGQKPDYMYLLQSLMMSNPAGAVGLAKGIVKQPGPPIDKATIANLFLQRQMYQEATTFLLDALEADLPEDGPLQTKLIEVNLMVKPDVADAILSNGTFSHYDRPRIAQLCEKAGLYMRALQHYSDLTDIKRCVVNTHAIDPTALTEYFGSLSSEWGLECLSELLHTNPTQNIPIVVNIAKEYTDAMGVTKIIQLFEEHQSYQALFMYLGARIAFSEDEEEHYKYIEAAAKCNQIREVERMTRESNFLPAQKVKGFLMDAKLPDARPLINVCDRFDMVNDLTTYLYANNMIRYIEGYVQKVNPAAAPQVVGGLLDCQASDDFISNLIMSVRSLLPVAKLCEEVEKRNRLKLLTPFLELLVGEGSTDPEVHNAMGKILIDTNNNPEHFLQQNPYYDSVVVGKYCEKRDPHLACVAFKRGQCDDELIDCTNRNSLFKLQARYLVERQNMDVYAKVLTEENPHRRAVIDQLVSTALPESKHPELVSCCVKAFMRADLQSELIELLEKIVLQNSAFSSNANLQNLLIITAIKSDPTRVLDYVRRLDGFEAMPVAEVALEFGQFDAAFEVYRKSNKKVEAVNVLLERLDDVTRAHEYATKVDDPAVWSVLGHSQLKRGLVSDAIGSYLLAKDSSKYLEVIKRASETQQYEDLVKYLMMVRKKVKDQTVDSEIVIAYAKTAQLGELENFISGTHQANLQVCGDRCFADGLYESARILFGYIPNYGKLASCLVHLKRFQEAVDAARKAASPATWKEVCFACVEVGEFKLAQLCGLNIIISTDTLDEVSEFYQVRGHFAELIALLESGIGLERAHMGIFTELGIMYANHEPAKLMEHLKLFATRLNIPRLIRTCEQQQLYNELTFLYVKYDEYDNALNVMMQHGPDAWEHVRFKDVAVKCSSVDIFYKAISHYLEYHPELLSDLVKVLEARIDHSRVVDILRRSKHLPLAKDYLVAVQKNNLPAVNEALNELLIDEEDFAGLRTSIEHYDNFDQLQMAGRLEDHELTEFRRIAGFIYKRNLKWRKAVEMAKKDELMKDAMEIASQSGEPDLVEDLLRFFTDTNNPECFAACLYTCYDLVKPDVAVELAWCNGLMDLIMPYLIQFLREYTSKVDLLMSERKEMQAAQQDTAADAAAQEAQRNAYAQLMPLALPAPPGANIPPYQAGPTGYGMPPPGPYM